MKYIHLNSGMRNIVNCMLMHKYDNKINIKTLKIQVIYLFYNI